MIAITTHMATGARRLRSFLRGLAEALDAFASYRAQRVVPERELRRVQREINRYRRTMSESAVGKVGAKQPQFLPQHN
jgi:hypothetical protein